MLNEWFKNWFDTPYYHALYFQHDETEAKDFIDQLVLSLPVPPNSKVLDVACGRGRHSKMLNKHTLDVTGIDLSLSSILAAKKFENETLHFHRHDMRHLFRIRCFDFVFNFFTSFGYFGTDQENLAALRTMTEALKPGGKLVLDYLNVYTAERNLKPTDVLTLGSYHFEIKRWQTDTHFYKQITVTEQGFLKPHTYTEEVSKFNLNQFKQMFDPLNFEITNVYGNHQLQPFSEDQSPRLIMVAQMKQY